MAGNGPPPGKTRRRRNRDELAEFGTQLHDGTTSESPPLPDSSPWSPHTLDWYETWRSSPQAAAFIATDWQRLHMIALLVEELPNADTPGKLTGLMSEIRINESLLGATHVDRLRARMKIERPNQGSGKELSTGVVDIAERRRRRMNDAS
ncbi:phage terminase small subunit [Salininema proteolyticum]|uniref:Terminase small subunit n=1 Tax=Salininema proteolyticum TaxID=1607685 RepID=A0ABV8TXU6_9ACTN